MKNCEIIASNPNNKNIKVSIVLPLYNQEKYLEECLKSVIKQTLKDIEIIIVNDGSTDSSLDIAKKFADKDNRIVIINKPNSGYGDSMNKGMDYAHGEYVGIVETDDYVSPNMFLELYKKAKKYDCDIVKADYCRFFGNGRQRRFVHMNIESDLSKYGKVLSLKEDTKLFHFSMTWAGIYKREFLNKNNIRHNTTPGASYQDNGFWFKSYSFADKIYYIPNEFYMYRFDNPNSSINNPDKVFNSCKEFELIYEFLEEHPEIKEKRLLRYYMEKFYCYKGTLNRIAPPYKYSFVKKMAEEFQAAKEKGEIDIDSMGKMGKEISDIIQSPEKYLLAEYDKKSKTFDKDITQQRKKNQTEKRKLYYRLGHKIGLIIKFIKFAIKYGIRYALRIAYYKFKKKLYRNSICKGTTNRIKDKEVIVSLTTYPARVKSVSLVVKSLLVQTKKPNRLLLYLAKEQFPLGEKALPYDLLELKKDGLEIVFCDDLKPHKKYYYAMLNNPDAIIITADDDVIYKRDWLERLWKSYKKFPKAISAMRARKILFDDKGDLLPYKMYPLVERDFCNTPRMDLIATGVGGVLYPPNLMDEELFNKNNIKELSLYTDDLWLKVMEILTDTPTVCLGINHANIIGEVQDVALYKVNLEKDFNDINLRRIIQYYDEFRNTDIVQRVRNYEK